MSHKPINAGSRIPDWVYDWAKTELAQREDEIRRARTYPDYLRMKERWDRRSNEAGISKAVRKQVMAAAMEERGSLHDLNTHRRAS